MHVASSKIPQADRLDTLRRVVQAIADGATTAADVGAAANLSRRHARYYFNAAVSLRFVTDGELDSSSPTQLGLRLLETTAGTRREAIIFHEAILTSDTIRELVGGDLLGDAASLDEIAFRLASSFGLSISTARRRARTLEV